MSMRLGWIPIWKTIPAFVRSAGESWSSGAPKRPRAAWARDALSGPAFTQMSRSFVKRGSAWIASACPPTSRYSAPAAFNSANRSLKSGFAGILTSPGQVLEGKAPDRLHALAWRDAAPELAVECSVVLAEADHARHGPKSSLTRSHRFDDNRDERTRLLRPPSSHLTPRAVERRALALDDAPDGLAAASRTLLALAGVDREGVLGGALLDVAHLRSLLARDGLLHGVQARAREPLHLRAREGVRAPARIHARPEERLAREDVADAGQQRLIEHGDLHRDLPARERRGEAGDVDALLERIGTERRHLRHVLEARPRHQPQPAEEARIAIVQDGAVVHVKANPRVAGRGLATRAAQPLARHPQVRDEPERLGARWILEAHQDVLAHPPHVAHPPARQRGGERPGPPWPEDALRLQLRLGALDAPPGCPRAQVSRRDLHLGELWHSGTVPSSRSSRAGHESRGPAVAAAEPTASRNRSNAPASSDVP